MKKLLSILLVAAMCFTSFVVLADETADENADVNDEVVVENDGDQAIDEDKDVDEVKAKEKDKAKDKLKEEEKDKVKEEAKDQDKTKPEKPSVDKEKENNSKSKVVKEELEKKKQERKEARLEAKDYIRGLKEIFKDADKATKKEILAEISGIKKELKDYSIGVFVKGLDIDFEKYDNIKPVIENNRTLIPIRAISESLGAEVAWNAETKIITIKKDDIEIILEIDNKIATVNGVEKELEVAPKISNNRTLVPIRFISENLNLDVEWDEDSKTIVIEQQEQQQVEQQ